MPAGKPRASWLDRALSTVGLQRAIPARPSTPAGRRAFHAANVDRLSVNLMAQTLSANDELRNDLRRLRGLSRRLCADTALGARLPNLIVEQVIGADGIRLQSRVEKRVGGLNKGLNKTLEDAWKRWGDPDTCTVQGTLSWVDVQEQFTRSCVVDGEGMLRIVRGAPNAWGFALEPLDIDLLDETFVGTWTNGNRVIMGVEVDRYSRPVAYHIWSQHPSEFATDRKRERVLARDIVHRFFVQRVKQVRGLPLATPILLDATALGAFLEASVHAARIGASRIAAVERDKDADVEEDQTYSDIPDEVAPGQVLDLPPGARINAINWQYPTGEIAPFVQIITRMFAAGTNVAYSSLTGDLSTANYSSLRAGRLTEIDTWRRMQRTVIEGLCWPVYKAWIDFAIMAGEIPARKNLGDYLNVKFQPRGWPWTDPLKDLQAQEMALANLLTTRRRIVGENGDDLEEILEGLAEEAALMKELGLEPALATKSKLDAPADAAATVDENGAASGDAAPARSSPVRILA